MGLIKEGALIIEKTPLSKGEIIRENATSSTLQKPVTGWMEALAITVHLTRKYFFT